MKKDMYKDLIDLGAPELPKGYYYSVIIDDKADKPNLYVTVCKRISMITGEVVGGARRYAYELNGEDWTVEDVIELCGKAHGIAFPPKPPDRFATVRKFEGRHGA